MSPLVLLFIRHISNRLFTGLSLLLPYTLKSSSFYCPYLPNQTTHVVELPVPLLLERGHAAAYVRNLSRNLLSSGTSDRMIVTRRSILSKSWHCSNLPTAHLLCDEGKYFRISTVCGWCEGTWRSVAWSNQMLWEEMGYWVRVRWLR